MIRCSSLSELSEVGRRFEAAGPFNNLVDIHCSNISLSKIEKIFIDARDYLAEEENLDFTGQLTIMSGIFTFGITTVMGIVGVLLKANTIRKKYEIEDKFTQKANIVRLYKLGYRIKEEISSEEFVISKIGRSVVGGYI